MHAGSDARTKAVLDESSGKAKITILIPVKDGGEGFRRCLDGIRDQKVKDAFELVVVDSGSTDGSRELAAAAGAKVLDIPPSEFNHGAARNLGALAGSGEILVFTVQDACPVGSGWLESLVAPLLADECVAGTYGRQLPHEDATPPEVWFLNFLYGPRPRTQQASSVAELSLETTMFSNVNSAIRRSAWEPDGFADDIIMSEDHEWARRALLNGWQIEYLPDAAVRHSHRYSVSDAFRRFFDSGVSAERAYLAGGAEASERLNSAALIYARGEIGWLIRTGRAGWIPYAVVYELAKWVGLQLGHRYRVVPSWLRPKLSSLPRYWDTRREASDRAP